MIRCRSRRWECRRTTRQRAKTRKRSRKKKRTRKKKPAQKKKQIQDSEETETDTDKPSLTELLGKDGKVPACPGRLDGKEFSVGRELMKLFDVGWSRGRITKNYKGDRKKNCEVQWFDEPGFLRDMLLKRQEYAAGEDDGRVGAWFFVVKCE